MSFLSIIQHIAEEVFVPIPSTLQQDNDAITQIKRLVNKEGQVLALMQSSMGGGWTVLERPHEFATVNGQDEYEFPPDYYKILYDTPWDRSRTRRMFGPLTTGEWQQLKSGLKTGTIYTSYRIRRSSTLPARRFIIDPPPSEAQTLFFEYLSSYWASDASGTNIKPEMTADDDESLIPDMLLEMGGVWRWKKQKGEDFSADLAEYEIRRDTMFGADHGPRVISTNKSKLIFPYDGDVPETGIGLP